MPDRIDKYTIVEEIGQGGMSVVYRGHDASLGRDVAIKVLHPHLARDAEARNRFSREARAIARLKHINIPEVYAFSDGDDQESYLVTELVEGPSLSARLAEGPDLLPEIAAMITLGIAHALAHAHSHRIIHRDVKPENVLLGPDGVVKLTDFGIAQILDMESLTMTGTLVGSPAHMAPEQIEGAKDLDYRVDIWALGTVLYTLSTGGALPFDASRPHAVFKRIMEGRYEDPRRLSPHIGSVLAGIIAHCLQVDRDQRYRAIGPLIGELERYLIDRGLEDPARELEAWVASPTDYQGALTTRLVAVYMRMGDAALASGARHEALEAFGRVLTLDPDHDEALLRVRRLGKGLVNRRRIRFLVGLFALALAASATFAFWPTPPPPAPPFDARAPAPLGVLGPPTAAIRHARTDVGTSGRVAGAAMNAAAFQAVLAIQSLPPLPGDAPGPEAPTRQSVRFSVSPPVVSIRVDGREIPIATPVSLTVGRHRVVLTHPECDECRPTTTRLLVQAQAGIQRAHFTYTPRFKPASLRVRCEGGTVSLDGKSLGSCGRLFSIPIKKRAPRLGVVAVTLADGTRKTKKISLKAGAKVGLAFP